MAILKTLMLQKWRPGPELLSPTLVRQTPSEIKEYPAPRGYLGA